MTTIMGFQRALGKPFGPRRESLEVRGSAPKGGFTMADYDIIHFEALGKEAEYLEEETKQEQRKGRLPQDLKYLVTPDSLQDFAEKNPGAVLPDLLTTKTHSILPEDYLSGVKKSVVTRSAGYDHFEHLAGAANIASLREYCVDAVAQTAIKFLYSAAGLLNHYTENIRTFERNKSLSFMELNPARTATVFGAGRIGKRTYDLLAANGLTVQAVDVRKDELDALYGGAVRFVSKEEAIGNSDVFVNAMNLTKLPGSRFFNVGYFSRDYLVKAKPGLIFINVTRGEAAPESALLELYDAKIIGGIGLDIFTDENVFSKVVQGQAPERPDHAAAKQLVERALNRSANIYVQPHQAFNSDLAALNKAREAILHIAAWYKNDKKRFDEQLPYYN
jgi:D-lactate dehydrogenase